MSICSDCTEETTTHLQADGDTELCKDCCGCNEY
jgi:hypothetical protein